MSLSDDAVERVVRSDTQHRAQLVRTIAQMLSSGVAIGDLWERCAPPMAELAGRSMTTVDACEAEGNFLRLLAEVEAGETIIITKNGHSVARLDPIVPEALALSADDAFEGLLAMRQPLRVDLQSLIEDGRRG
jgi:antitoxin (DNA-binding transcriptional repressor) of toxin-antitoxin stability system